MKYNFDSINNRVGTNSVKWDIHPDVIPLWVADMDFQVFPELKEALSKRVDEGIFGYTLVPESYYEAITRRCSFRHQSITVSSQALPIVAVSLSRMNWSVRVTPIASTLLILKISVPIPRPRFFCSVIPIILLAECGLRKNWNA